VAVKVGVTVRVYVHVAVYVGDQHMILALTQFEDIGAAAPAEKSISAWLEIVELHAPVAAPHHVKDPDLSDCEPMAQFTTPPACVQLPALPTYVTPVGTVSYTAVFAAVTLGAYTVKLSYES
jgi:hypothetical protein